MKSIIQSGTHCLVCGDPCTDCHHIFGGPNRQLSEKYGLTVYLCRYHHNIAHRGGVLMDGLREDGERAFLRQYNATVADFRRIFGKNYL